MLSPYHRQGERVFNGRLSERASIFLTENIGRNISDRCYATMAPRYSGDATARKKGVMPPAGFWQATNQKRGVSLPVIGFANPIDFANDVGFENLVCPRGFSAKKVAKLYPCKIIL
ncbi:hypothetical protein BIY26_06990 [Brenneria goodwinii]|uniref:Uncharacterized protein n=1 Tax=Brenneria goodwinii TaxID=1109412 RepID=A0AAE8ERD1_9GAMM|nr:hypothetical protein [Brenneria goodwinii]ATA25521.1 hypothetical protein AWC36_16160 [Brenneria goodwinii]MCG8156403.1 hypothetical protein [Brenneria goodwinii]MCG8163322.1 hypothetical protein [Brenneria goodwinii]MCG8167742.1 hypothetical protein [Brenneria goodwinii]MCG8172233.1 hypothetical protein [Brenneria goodwinii]